MDRNTLALNPTMEYCSGSKNVDTLFLINMSSVSGKLRFETLHEILQWFKKMWSCFYPICAGIQDGILEKSHLHVW